MSVKLLGVLLMVLANRSMERDSFCSYGVNMQFEFFVEIWGLSDTI